MKKVAIYVRCANEAQGLDLQARLQNAVAGQTDWKLVGCYVDTGYNGLNIDRPALHDLLSACAAGTVEAIVVKEFASLSRNAENTRSLVKLFQKNGITIYQYLGESFEPAHLDYPIEMIYRR